MGVPGDIVMRQDATLDFAGAVYDLPEITGDQSRAARKALVRRELDRAQRIEARDITPEKDARLDLVVAT